jgi:hypothetical protein
MMTHLVEPHKEELVGCCKHLKHQLKRGLIVMQNTVKLVCYIHECLNQVTSETNDQYAKTGTTTRRHKRTSET